MQCGSPVAPPGLSPAAPREAATPVVAPSPTVERGAATAVPGQVVIARTDVLDALYAQGRAALHRGDGAAAVAALRPVTDEAPNAYPEAHRLLAEAQSGRAGGAAAGTVGRRAAGAIGAAVEGRAARASQAVAAAWQPWAGPVRERVERLPGGRRALATAGPWLRATRGALPARAAFPVWALGLALIVLVGGLLLQRAGSAGPRAADAREVPPVPTLESEADLAARCRTTVDAASWADAIRACRILHARTPDREGLADDLAKAYVGRAQARVAAGDDLAGATSDFQQALSFQPESSVAQEGAKLLALYQAGDKAMSVGDWPTAVAQFSAAYADQPDYMQSRGARSLRGRLFAAWLAWGESALNADAAPDAVQRCSQALTIVPDDPDAERCLARARGTNGDGGPPGESPPTSALAPAPGPREARMA
jgi:tetratricopeptide (TPR) repeat protein